MHQKKLIINNAKTVQTHFISETSVKGTFEKSNPNRWDISQKMCKFGELGGVG